MEKEPRPSNLSQDITPDLEKRIDAGETLSAQEIGDIQAIVMKSVVKDFIRGAGKKEHELVLRNPAVLFDSISEREYEQLPEEIRRNVELAADIAAALAKATYREKIGEYTMQTEGDEFRSKIGSPLNALQRLVFTGEVSREDQPYVGLAIRELSQIMSETWQHAQANGWREVVTEHRRDYYSSNATASYRKMLQNQR